MATTLKVREKGILVLPKALREKAGIVEGSTVVAIAVEDGIILSPKETDILGRLLGLAKVRKGSPRSTDRVRSLRSRIDDEQFGNSNG